MFKRNKRGQIAFFIIFLFLATVVIVIGAVAGPLGGTIATEFYSAGEDLLIDTQQGVVTEIQDPEVRAALNSTFDAATNAATTNIEVSTGLYQWSWVFVLILTAIVLYLATRQTVAFRAI